MSNRHGVARLQKLMDDRFAALSKGEKPRKPSYRISGSDALWMLFVISEARKMDACFSAKSTASAIKRAKYIARTSRKVPPSLELILMLRTMR